MLLLRYSPHEYFLLGHTGTVRVARKKAYTLCWEITYNCAGPFGVQYIISAGPLAHGHGRSSDSPTLFLRNTLKAECRATGRPRSSRSVRSVANSILYHQWADSSVVTARRLNPEPQAVPEALDRFYRKHTPETL